MYLSLSAANLSMGNGNHYLGDTQAFQFLRGLQLTTRRWRSVSFHGRRHRNSVGSMFVFVYVLVNGEVSAEQITKKVRQELLEAKARASTITFCFGKANHPTLEPKPRVMAKLRTVKGQHMSRVTGSSFVLSKCKKRRVSIER